jgi:hypothetical protein
MTKEMRPAHRANVLSHALLYYASIKEKKLAQLLVQRYKKASGLHDVAKKTYINYVSALPGTFN